MNKDDLIHWRSLLRASPSQAARLLGLSESDYAALEAGARPIPETVMLLSSILADPAKGHALLDSVLGLDAGPDMPDASPLEAVVWARRQFGELHRLGREAARMPVTQLLTVLGAMREHAPGLIGEEFERAEKLANGLSAFAAAYAEAHPAPAPPKLH